MSAADKKRAGQLLREKVQFCYTISLLSLSNASPIHINYMALPYSYMNPNNVVSILELSSESSLLDPATLRFEKRDNETIEPPLRWGMA